MNLSFIFEAFKHEVETASDLGNLITSNCILRNKSVFRKGLHLHVKSINSVCTSSLFKELQIIGLILLFTSVCRTSDACGFKMLSLVSGQLLFSLGKSEAFVQKLLLNYLPYTQ